MNDAKELLTGPEDQHEPAVGLVANGSAGSWDVGIDETTVGERRWFAQIEGPSVYLYFELPSPLMVGELFQFLDRRAGVRNGPRAPGAVAKGESLSVGSFGQYSVRLAWDDEFEDRCFVVIGPSATSTVRLTLVGEDAVMLARALGQAREDLRDAGLLGQDQGLSAQHGVGGLNTDAGPGSA